MVLSICIPTYNRCSSVSALVSSILKYKNNNVEIYVLDNCSTDGTVSALRSLRDDRLHVVTNVKNTGGHQNPIDCLKLGNGAFKLLCLDKDIISSDVIEKLCNFLDMNPETAAGFHNLNLSGNSDAIIFEPGYTSLNNIAFQSRHPSGMFFNSAMLNEIGLDRTYAKKNITFGGFFFDFLLADFCLLGKTVILNNKGINTETTEVAASNKSFTYSSSKKNIFFYPEERYITCKNYLKYIMDLCVKKDQKIHIAKKVISNMFTFFSWDRQYFSNANICNHYHMPCRSIPAYEVNWNVFKYGALLLTVDSILIDSIIFIAIFSIISDWNRKKRKQIIKLLKKNVLRIKPKK